jgi:hypothetical protein
MAERLRDEPHLRLRYFCSPYYQDTALFPFVEQLGRAAGFARDDPAAGKLEKLEALLARAAPTNEDVALLADLLSLPVSGHYPLPNLSPQRKKEKTLEVLIRQLGGFGAPAAGSDGVRGRALDRPDFARIARPDRRSRAEPAGAPDHDLPTRVPTALDRPDAGDDAGAQSAGPA